MAALNPLTRELVFKIVFYGPGLGGKTTTLQHIHAHAKPEHRGNMVSLATDTDRTLYFDFLPLQVLRLRSMSVRLQLFTVPGQVYYSATRKLVLTGADGIVFVADSQAARGEANQESLDDLNANLAEHGRALSRIPHTFQWNKRDLPETLSVEDLDRRLNLFSAPSIGTVATTGDQVFEGLEQITRAAFNAYKAELPQGKRGKVPLFLDADEVGLADAIRELADSQRASPRPPSERTPGNGSSGARALEAALSEPRIEASRVEEPTSAPASAPASSGASASANTGATAGAATRLSPTLSPSSSTAKTASPAPPAVTSSSSTFTLAELWPASERDAVRRAELLLGGGDRASAVIAVEALVTRVLASASIALGSSDQAREPALLALLLGVDGPRYLAYRATVRAARQNKELAARDALDCFLVAVDARRGLNRTPR